jgi:hypothetical protein
VTDGAALRSRHQDSAQTSTTVSTLDQDASQGTEIPNDSLLDRKMNYVSFVHMFELEKEFLSSLDHEHGFKKMGIIA